MSEAQHSPENSSARAAPARYGSTSRPRCPDGPVLTIVGDSDAYIVRGLIAILLSCAMSGKRASEILSIDALATFDELGLRAHLTPQRVPERASRHGRAYPRRCQARPGDGVLGHAAVSISNVACLSRHQREDEARHERDQQRRTCDNGQY